MKPLSRNTKQPRGYFLHKNHDKLRESAMSACAKAQAELAFASDRLFEIGERSLGESARRVKREAERLERRIAQMDTVIPRGRPVDPSEV